MKVLNINRFYYQRGGADTYFFGVADILQKMGHSVIPFSTILKNNKPSSYSRHFVTGYTEDTFPNLNIFRKAQIFFNGIYSLEAKKKLRQLIKQEKPDLAHIHGVFYQLSLSVFDVLKEQNIPIVMGIHDYFFLCANGYLYRDGHICQLCKGNRNRFLLFNKCFKNSYFPSAMAYLAKKLQNYRKTLNHIDIFTVPQETMQKLLVEWGMDKNKIRILNNPFDSSNSIPNYIFEDYIIFLGRFVRLKGVFTILKAMIKLRDIKLKMFGSGPDRKEMEKYILEHDLSNVEINSWFPLENGLANIISKAKFVVSAPEWYQPSDYTAYLSFALGKPVITSAIGGQHFLVKDEYNGLLFKPGDENSLAKKIKDLFYNLPMIIKMGKNARYFVETELSFERFYSKLISIYEEVVKNKPK